jgi:hypothetical protein
VVFVNVEAPGRRQLCHELLPPGALYAASAAAPPLNPTYSDQAVQQIGVQLLSFSESDEAAKRWITR